MREKRKQGPIKTSHIQLQVTFSLDERGFRAAQRANIPSERQRQTQRVHYQKPPIEIACSRLILQFSNQSTKSVLPKNMTTEAVNREVVPGRTKHDTSSSEA